jgi:tetratricopeptide (TPR) repeat protein
MPNARRVLLPALWLLAVPALLQAQGRGGGQPLKNLQVLPKEMSRQEVTALMRTFALGLGVRCEFCHQEAADAAAGGGGRGGFGGGPPLDYALDTKETKKVAREMLKMVNDINGKYLAALGRTIADRDRVTCETCHHGLSKPRTLRSALTSAIEAGGADSAVALYRDLRTRYYGSAAYDFSEMSLTLAATDLARSNQRPAALALLKLNLEYFSESVPTYQSLAQISLQAGDTTTAIAALTKAIAIQPDNNQLQQMLQRIKQP